MKFTGDPIASKKPTLEQRIAALEEQVFTSGVWYSEPLCKRERATNALLNKLITYLGLYLHTENRPVPDQELRRMKRWWQL